MISAGAKAIPEGGYFSMPRLHRDGFMILGDSGGFLNGARLKGIHLAFKSGIMAAEAAVQALLSEDYSAQSVSAYETAFEDLPDAIRQMLLHGSGTEEIAFVYEAEGTRGKQRRLKRKHPFEGILPNLERRYRETDSTAVREDLMRYQSAKPCPDCHGTRLRSEARHVFLVDVDATGADRREPIFRVEHFTLRAALDYWRYPDARWDHSPKLRRRAQEQAPAFAIVIANLPLLGTRAGRAVLVRLFHAIDRLLPPPAEVTDVFRRIQPAGSSARFPMNPARPPSAAVQAATFAAWPPGPTRVRP
jgi:hypothetical protein